MTVMRNEKELINNELNTNKIKYKEKVALLNAQVTEQLRQI